MRDTKKIRFLFYKTPWVLKLKYWVNWLISIRTLSKYSHCEAQTPDELGRFCKPMGEITGSFITDQGCTYTLYAPRDIPVGKCWTSTLRGEDNGTVCRDAAPVLKHPKNWIYFEIEVDAKRYDAVVKMMKAAVKNNKGYSNWDVLKFISPVHFPDNDRFICSEFVIWVLFWLDLSPTKGIVSPGYIYKMLIKMGCEAKELS